MKFSLLPSPSCNFILFYDITTERKTNSLSFIKFNRENLSPCHSFYWTCPLLCPAAINFRTYIIVAFVFMLSYMCMFHYLDLLKMDGSCSIRKRYVITAFGVTLSIISLGC